MHEVHVHDNGLFGQLMGWLEGILEFLRHGPKGGKLDMNALFQGAVDMHKIDKEAAIAEIDELIKWQEERKKWHQDKTRQKMAASSSPSMLPPSSASNPSSTNQELPSTSAFKSSDFGLNESDLAEMQSSSPFSTDDSTDDSDDKDPIASERKRRRRKQNHLRRTAGEPVKPDVRVLGDLREGFLAMLMVVLDD